MTDQQEQEQAQGEDLEARIDAASQSEETEEPTPSSEEVSEDTEPQEDVTEEEALANAKNPERTRKYIEKLKQQAQAGSKPNVFDQIRPVPTAESYDNLNQAQVDDIASNFVDNDGTVDIERLNQALREANERSNQAVAQAQQMTDRITRYEESRQLQEAYVTYPQLDPENSKFDPDFYDLVSKEIMVENFARGGNLTVKQAGDKIASVYNRPNTAKEKQKAVEDYKKSQENRQQGPIEKGRGQDRVETGDLDDLRTRSRRGDDVATAERLKNLGI